MKDLNLALNLCAENKTWTFDDTITSKKMLIVGCHRPDRPMFHLIKWATNEQHGLENGERGLDCVVIKASDLRLVWTGFASQNRLRL